MTIFYKFQGRLYANITNRCPCSCVFCIRKNGDGVGDSDNLWLEREPTLEEINKAFDECDREGMDELVFCGYGEPMERADVLMDVARHVKRVSDMKIRINTNGLVNLIDPSFDVYSMRYIIDSISVSLNAPDADSYYEVTQPAFGLPAYHSMINFALLAKSIVGDVTFTVVDVISKEQTERCRKLADDLHIPLRIRHYVTDNESYT